MMPQMLKAQETGDNGSFFWAFHEKDTNPYITLGSTVEDIVDKLSLGPKGENRGLKNGTWLELQRTETDAFGNVHVTYNQKTDASQYSSYQLILHFLPDGSLYYKNGLIILEPKDSQDTRALSAANVISAESASLIATGDPLSEAVRTYANYHNTPREAYKVKDARKMQYVYVDAYSGEVLYTIPIIHSFVPWSAMQGRIVTLPANTSYHGLHELTMLQTDNGYILRDPLRNIITIDATDVLSDGESSSGEGYSEILAGFTQLCNDVSFANEEDLLTQKYTTRLSGLTLWIDSDLTGPTTPVDINIFYVDDNKECVSDVITTSIDGEVSTDEYGDKKVSVTFPSKPVIDLVNYHHVVEVSFDGIKHKDFDIIKPGNGVKATAYVEEQNKVLNYLFDVETDALQPSIDVHWAIQKVYDMYDDYFGIKGCDGKGSQILNIVNPSNKVMSLSQSSFPNNACALGTEISDCNGQASYVMLYGMGSAGAFKPLTPFDVTAHEFTHNLTAGCCNGLQYSNESGSLNEALADCMAMVAENYLLGTPTWLVGENVTLYSENMRSCIDPWYSGCINDAIDERYAQPKYYGGRFWFDYTAVAPSDENDYGGVHTNSGVFNHLFYLLCEGAHGLTNEVGQTADFLPAGIDKIKNIVFHTMRYYNSTLCSYKEIADNLLMAVGDIYASNNETITDLQKTLLTAYEFVGMESGLFPTSIDRLQIDDQTTDPRSYNLYGIPVGEGYKGIVIKDGKKVIVNR